MFLYEKKNSFTEKTINENVKKKIYLISEIYFYTEKILIFLKYMFILQKKNFLIIKNIFV